MFTFKGPNGNYHQRQKLLEKAAVGETLCLGGGGGGKPCSTCLTKLSSLKCVECCGGMLLPANSPDSGKQ